MTQQYIQDPNDETKVIDTSIQPPSIDPKDLEQQLAKLIETETLLNQRQESNRVQKVTIQAQLDAIYTQVPEVRPLEDNQTSQ